MKPRSNFNFNILEQDSIVVIFDQKTGMSVTNDIENVVEYIAHISDIHKGHYRWLYRDSYDLWNEYCPLQDTWTDVDVAEISKLLLKVMPNQAN